MRPPPAYSTRRRTLKLALGGAGALLFGGGALHMLPGVPTKPPGPLLSLTPSTYSTLVAVADCLLPDTVPFPAASAMELAWKMDTVFSKAHPAVAAEFNQLLQVIESGTAGLLLAGSPKPFTKCDHAAKIARLQRLQESPISLIKGGFKALNSLCKANYYANPDTHALVGYPGPPPALLRMVEAQGEMP